MISSQPPNPFARRTPLRSDYNKYLRFGRTPRADMPTRVAGHARMPIAENTVNRRSLGGELGNPQLASIDQPNQLLLENCHIRKVVSVREGPRICIVSTNAISSALVEGRWEKITDARKLRRTQKLRSRSQFVRCDERENVVGAALSNSARPIRTEMK